MDVFRACALTNGLWQVHRCQGERLVRPIGPQVETEAESLFIAYRLARAEIVNPPWQPVWDEPPL